MNAKSIIKKLSLLIPAGGVGYGVFRAVRKYRKKGSVRKLQQNEAMQSAVAASENALFNLDSIYRNKVKRILSFTGTSVGLLLFGWVYAVIALAIVIDDPGPVFFKQRRVGQDKELFEILKFRTMKVDTPHDMPTHLLKDPEQYITRVGKLLRKYSLDELPQLFNVIKGEMALVGPRPALWNQFDLIEERDKYDANSVKPGITGWAQIHGRDELEIPVKAKLDGYYVEHISFLMDIKCLFGTVLPVVTGSGVVEGGTGAMQADSEITATE